MMDGMLPRFLHQRPTLPMLAASLALAALLSACKLLPQGEVANHVAKPATKATSVTANAPSLLPTFSAPTPAARASAATPASRKPTRKPVATPKAAEPEAPLLLSQPPAQLLLAPAPVPERSAAPAAPASAAPTTPPLATAPPPMPAAPGESAAPPPGFLLPGDLFHKPGSSKPAAAPAAPGAPAATPSATGTPAAGVTPAPATTPAPVERAAVGTNLPAARKPFDDITRKLVSTKLPPVYIYASPTSRNYMAAGGINYQNNIDTWHFLLKRLDIPFEIIDTLAPFEKTGFKAANSLLILPSSVALSETERRSLTRYHDQGGALLASWLCGVRNERGEWLGFGFMENVLGTKVVGSTDGDNDDSFLIPYGNSPVSHQLPAGLRVWTERIPDWYPLRLSGPHLAAQIMDWSRSAKQGKSAGLISWDQRAVASGTARSVVLGYPERLWFSADPKAFDALAGDALFWLLRQPAVYLSNWPHPYQSAFMLAINASEFNEEADNAFARQTEGAGWHGTYYVLSESAEAGKPLLTKLQQRGHEIAYFGDRLTSFQNQSANQQKKRIDTMVNELKELEIEATQPPGFRAPMEAFDATTLRLLRAKGISHIVTDQGASETRLPLIVPGPVAANGEQLVLLPRTLSAPEDLFTDNTPAQAIGNFLTELDLSMDMGGLGVVSLPTRSSLSGAQWGEILARLKARDKQPWLTTANILASWWREHERVKLSLNTDVSPALLSVEVSGDAPLQQAVTLLVNLPQPGRMPRLLAGDSSNGNSGGDGSAPLPKVTTFDALRAALILPNLAPGKYEWYLSFPATTSATSP